MTQKKYFWIGVITVSLAIIISSFLMSDAFKYRYKSQDVISVTGLGEQEFVSDLIVLRAGFSQTNPSLQLAYKALDADRMAITKYLNSKGINDSEVVFSFVNVFKQSEPIYANNGNYAGSRFSEYRLNQNFTIESKEVEKIELLSREISEIISQGIVLESQNPEYYYTKLSDLKIELINKATEDARSRAQAIADKSNSKLGKLKTGKMGVFQITAPNSNEALSWGGSYNSGSKNKKASITMKLEYHTK